MNTPRKALALISGGLDSMLAAKVIQEQGILVEGINFYTGFCIEGHTQAVRRHVKPKRNNALWVAEQLGIKLHIADVVEEYKDVLLNPRYGYGSNINPCLDCKIFMVKKALAFCEQHGLDFVITGEVVGQRPNSQLKHRMFALNKNIGADGADRLLRPLCAKLFEPTLPEREGWVDRNQLHDFNGRSRKPQIALAEKYGFTDYAQPAGGCCFLTDAGYAAKLRDLWESRRTHEYELDDIILLKMGRHIRPAPHFKVIVGREEGENNFLQGYRNQFISLALADDRGPLVLCDGDPLAEDITLAARITARFSQSRHEAQVRIRVQYPKGREEILTVAPLPPEQLPESWYL